MILPVGPGIGAQPSAASPARRSGSTAGAGFRAPGEAASAPVQDQSAAEQIAPASLAGLLALQEFNADEQQRQLLRHGQALLAKLSRLQQAILAGAEDGEALAELAELAATPIDTADPRLRALIGAVLLRVRIELAKRGR